MRGNCCDGKVRYTHLWIKSNWERPTNYIFAILDGTASLEKFPQFSGDLRQIDAIVAEMNLQSFKFLWSYASDSSRHALIMNNLGVWLRLNEGGQTLFEHAA